MKTSGEDLTAYVAMYVRLCKPFVEGDQNTENGKWGRLAMGQEWAQEDLQGSAVLNFMEPCSVPKSAPQKCGYNVYKKRGYLFIKSKMPKIERYIIALCITKEKVLPIEL